MHLTTLTIGLLTYATPCFAMPDRDSHYYTVTLDNRSFKSSPTGVQSNVNIYMSSARQYGSLTDCWIPSNRPRTHFIDLRNDEPRCGLGVDLITFDAGWTDARMILYKESGCRDEDIIAELGTGVYWFNRTEPPIEGWYTRSWRVD